MLPCGEMLIMFGGLRLGGKFEVKVGRCEMKILLFLSASLLPRKASLLLESPQASADCSDRSSVKMKMCIEHWWN
jgi:hypothetical protein